MAIMKATVSLEIPIVRKKFTLSRYFIFRLGICEYASFLQLSWIYLSVKFDTQDILNPGELCWQSLWPAMGKKVNKSVINRSYKWKRARLEGPDLLYFSVVAPMLARINLTFMVVGTYNNAFILVNFYIAYRRANIVRFPLDGFHLSTIKCEVNSS